LQALVFSLFFAADTLFLPLLILWQKYSIMVFAPSCGRKALCDFSLILHHFTRKGEAS